MNPSLSDNERVLDVLIATHGIDGLQRVAEMTLPPVKGVTYIVTWQEVHNTQNTFLELNIPQKLQRIDIEIYPIDSIGSSNNHNATMSFARARYCLIADNDLHYTSEGLKAVIECFDNNLDTDIATFRHSGEPVIYPTCSTPLSLRLPKGYSVTSFEIAYRRERIGDIQFDPNFGIGAPMAAAEDGLFLLDCRRKGLHCRFFPVTIVSHPDPTTGYRPINDAKIAAAEGAYIRLEYGIAGFPRIILFAWRAKRSGRMPFLWGLRQLTRGFFSKYVRLHRRNHF